MRWDEEKAYWTSAGFYGISFNEGKQTLSFKTMHFGIFGLSAFRFSNLPFQSWELRPDSATRAVIALSAAAVQVSCDWLRAAVILSCDWSRRSLRWSLAW